MLGPIELAASNTIPVNDSVPNRKADLKIKTGEIIFSF
jgi:hypothetical protein